MLAFDTSLIIRAETSLPLLTNHSEYRLRHRKTTVLKYRERLLWKQPSGPDTTLSMCPCMRSKTPAILSGNLYGKFCPKQTSQKFSKTKFWDVWVLCCPPLLSTYICMWKSVSCWNLSTQQTMLEVKPLADYRDKLLFETSFSFQLLHQQLLCFQFCGIIRRTDQISVIFQ